MRKITFVLAFTVFFITMRMQVLAANMELTENTSDNIVVAGQTASEASAVSGARQVPHYTFSGEPGGYGIGVNGDVWNGEQYFLKDGTLVVDAFFCDGVYTYYLQADGMSMKNRLTYHPDGEHVIYFDKRGHEVFSSFAHVVKSISGDEVDDLCFFDVYGYMYQDVQTYGPSESEFNFDKFYIQSGEKYDYSQNQYYVNPCGVIERKGWFCFSNGERGFAKEDGTLEVNKYMFDTNGIYVYLQGNGHVQEGLSGEAMANHRKQEIRNFYQAYPFSLNYSDMSLEEDMQSALNAINAIRYIAGVESNVVINEQYNVYASNASYINKLNGVLTHYPNQPAGVDDQTYESGYFGASHSNIAMGYGTITSSIVDGYMEDGDAGNIDRVGHRRWILWENLREVGMGKSGAYSALFVIPDTDNMSYEERKGLYDQTQNVMWPAAFTPNEIFGMLYPWSISYCNGYDADISEVSVTLNGDGKTWIFDAADSEKADINKEYFNINHGGYGGGSCIIFRPPYGDINPENGGTYTVKVNGLKDSDGNAVPLSYTVTFFDLQ